MDANEAYRALAAALRKMHLANEHRDRELAALRAELGELQRLLVSREGLVPGHLQFLAKVGERAARAASPKVSLGPPLDKYKMGGGDVDCLERIPLCRGRCCSFTFALTAQDLEEALVPWEVERPYLIYHEADGYCRFQDRETRTCTIYEQRPFACRSFTCRDDPRLWTDFAARIPAPVPSDPSPADFDSHGGVWGPEGMPRDDEGR